MKYFILLIACIVSSFSYAGNLTWETAKSRREYIRDVSYDIGLEFFEGKDFFLGKTTITLSLKKVDQPLEIDHKASELKKVLINDKEIKGLKSESERIVISPEYLSKEMRIEIEYAALFDGMAIKHFTDPLDKSEYVYTNLQPYQAHYVFPCIDQPDIKARMTLKVTAPKKWHIINNELLKEKVSQGDKVISFFNTTPLLSTYLFFVGGGEVVQVSDNYNGLPLNLYTRKSLAGHLDAKNIFQTTKKGLGFFQDYFGHPYPFSKYDHFFVPDYGYGGMENPGAVILNERYVFKGSVPRSYHLKRDEVIFHEMAHMWFGDLVTMKWWNDLWLNESFASYLAAIALEEAVQSKNSWVYFLSTKNWGYRDDSYENSNHPIVGDIPDTLTSESSFDGITYAKGAASLKQLHYLVGDEAFRKGLQKYFKTYAFKNTTLKDFIGSISEFTPKDLNAWAKSWLSTKGVHEITPKFNCENGKISTFEIHQKPNEGEHYSPHKTSFAFYLKEGKDFKLLSQHGLEYQSAKTSFPTLVGTKCPDFVLPNDKDYDYGFFNLDERSMMHAEDAIGKLPDPIGRLSLWISLEQSLKRGRLKPKEFFRFVHSSFKHEKNSDVLSLLLGVQQSRMGLLKEPFFAYLNKIERKEISGKLESLIFNKMINTDLYSEERKTFFDIYVLVANSKMASRRLLSIIKKNDGIRGIKFTQEVRWMILQKLSRMKHPEALKLIEAEKSKDLSFVGKASEFSARISYPDIKIKTEAWDIFLNPEKTPYTTLKTASEFVHNGDYPELSMPFLQKYFEKITSVDWQVYEGYVDLYFHELFPLKICSQDALSMSDKYFKLAKNLTPFARLRWAMVHEDLKRCVLARKI